MKVLFVAPRYDESAGDGVYVKRLALALIANGLHVDVFSTIAGRFALADYSSAKQSESQDNLEVLNGLGATDQSLIGKNFYSSEARSSLKRILQVLKPDVIHIHGIHQIFTISCLLELKQYGTPIVMTVHDYKIVCGNASFFSDRREEPCTRCLRGNIRYPIFECCKKNSRFASLGVELQMAVWKYSNALDAVDKFLVGSQFVLDLLSINTNLMNRLKLCRFPSPEQIQPPDLNKVDNPSLSFIGRLVPHKGFSIFAQTVSGFQVPIHIFGDGDLMHVAKRMLQDNTWTTFHGWVSQLEMAKYLSLGSIVVVPSLAYETFCYVVVEAMMRGCCVVASSRGGIPELIQDGQNGIIVDPPTPDGFRKAITMLLSDKDKRVALGRQALRITDNLPTVASHANQILDVYQTLTMRKS